MKKSINEYEFIQEFQNNQTYKNNFSVSGLRNLYQYLTELEEDADIEIEFDIVAICCDFTEYEDFEELQDQYYNLGLKTIEDYYDYTTVIQCDNGSIIIQTF